MLRVGTCDCGITYFVVEVAFWYSIPRRSPRNQITHLADSNNIQPGRFWEATTEEKLAQTSSGVPADVPMLVRHRRPAGAKCSSSVGPRRDTPRFSSINARTHAPTPTTRAQLCEKALSAFAGHRASSSSGVEMLARLRTAAASVRR